jgi:hypothetical protein
MGASGNLTARPLPLVAREHTFIAPGQRIPPPIDPKIRGVKGHDRLAMNQRGRCEEMRAPGILKIMQNRDVAPR